MGAGSSLLEPYSQAYPSRAVMGEHWLNKWMGENKDWMCKATGSKWCPQCTCQLWRRGKKHWAETGGSHNLEGEMKNSAHSASGREAGRGRDFLKIDYVFRLLHPNGPVVQKAVMCFLYSVPCPQDTCDLISIMCNIKGEQPVLRAVPHYLDLSW